MIQPLLIAIILCGTAAAQTNWYSRTAADPALSGRERFQLFVHNDFASPGAFFRTVGPSLGEQISNEPRDWGRTGEGFGRRVGTNFVKYTSRDIIQSTESALIGFDPRYQKCGCKGGWQRTGHAFSGLFLSADSHGGRRFDPTRILAAYGSGYIASTLYPDRYSIAVKGAQMGHSLAGEVIIDNLFEEFGPDIKKFLRQKILRRP